MTNNIVFPIEFDHCSGGMMHSVISLINGLSKNNRVYIITYKEADITRMNLNAHLLLIRSPWVVSMRSPLKTIRTYMQVKKKIQLLGKEILIITNNVGSELIFSGFGFFPIKGIRVFVSRGGNYGGKTGFFLKIGFKSVTHFIAISTHQKRILENCGIQSNRISIINNGITVKNSYLKKINDIRNLSVVGYISGNKNQILAIKALSLLVEQGYKNLILNIYGTALSMEDKNYESRILYEIKKNNLESCVKFHGYCSYFEIYGNTDILLSTSLSEGFGRTLIEAMSFGIPCIALKEAGGPCDIINNDVNGILINNDEFELSKSIKKLINEYEYRNNISKNAFETYKFNFTEEMMISNYKFFLNKID